MKLFQTTGSIYHAQEAGGLCAAAVALSILSDKDIGRSIGSLDETTLYCFGHSKSDPNWSVDPSGFQDLLNKETLNKKYFSSRLETHEIATSRIVSGITSPNPVPPAALLFGGQHWASVHGADIDGDISAAYRLLLLWLFDPQGALEPVPPHSDGDQCPDLGIADYAVFYPWGWARYFPGDDSDGDDTPLCVSLTLDSVSQGNPPLAVSPPPVPTPLDGTIDSASRAWKAWSPIYAPAADSPAAGIFSRSKVLAVTKNSDLEIGDDLYIVQLGETSVEASLIMDANGVPISLQIPSKESPYLDFLKKLRTTWVDEELVWRPSLASFSPHLPFRRRLEGGFERLDGRVFESLEKGKGA
jgi:hypothetical protein